MEPRDELRIMNMERTFAGSAAEMVKDPQKMQKLLDCLRSRFTGRMDLARRLLLTSESFREACIDYFDIKEILESKCNSDDPFPEICEHARDLTEELEQEILRAMDSSQEQEKITPP